MRKTFAIFLLCLISCGAYAQILPEEDRALNYRLIGFAFPKGQAGAMYKVEVAEGRYNNADSFRKKIIVTFTTSQNKVIGEVPSFGKEYSWRVVYTGEHAVKNKPGLHHFSTRLVPEVNPEFTRLRMIKNTVKNKDQYIFVDGTKTLYDMNGKPVWFLPEIEGEFFRGFVDFGDLKLTDKGTITFMSSRKGGQIFEANYNGDVVWKGPAEAKVGGDVEEHYNHQFSRLPDGNYMVLGNENVLWKLPGSVDSNFLKNNDNKGKVTWDSKTNAFYEHMPMTTLIEYDSLGNIVWSWKSADYFKQSDLYNHVNKMGVFDIDDVHENAFYFDEEKKVVYVSFKGMSRVLKIQYPQGNVLKEYGKKYTPAAPDYNSPLFYHQHSCGVTSDGYLYVYNNNNRYEGAKPTLTLMREPLKPADTLERVWEYRCTITGVDTASFESTPDFAGLGGMVELPDRSLLGCMTTDEYTKIFIVNRDKEEVWSALPEHWISEKNKWVPVLVYRANFIADRAALERFVWSVEMGARSERQNKH